MDGAPTALPVPPRSGSYWQCLPDLLIEEVGDEIVVYAPGSGRSAVLNLVGGAVLDLCEATRSVDEIATEIAAALNAAPATIAADVAHVLDEYAALGLVRVES